MTCENLWEVLQKVSKRVKNRHPRPRRNTVPYDAILGALKKQTVYNPIALIIFARRIKINGENGRLMYNSVARERT